jgi:hypothetical protein
LTIRPANTSTTQALPLGLCHRKGVSRAARNQPSLKFCHGCHLLQEEAPGSAFELGEISEPQIDAGFQKARKEGHRAGEAIEFGNDKRALVKTRGSECLLELGPISAPAAFDLREFRDDRPASAIEIARNGVALSFKPETARALAIRRDSVIRYELALRCHLKPPLHSSQRPFVAM